MVCEIMRSVSKSTLAVGSSSSTIFLFYKRARPRHRSYFCPNESIVQSLEMKVESCSGSERIRLSRCTAFRALQSTSSSSSSPVELSYYRTEPFKRKGFWEMKVIEERSELTEISVMSLLPIRIEPSGYMGVRRRRAWRRELLPAPVRPTTPTLLHGGILKVKLERA